MSFRDAASSVGAGKEDTSTSNEVKMKPMSTIRACGESISLQRIQRVPLY
ncbi:hypothetical protein [Salsuginibacillus kocurii]|nr:hypothetical protein [Salsuginibacillus kocurii]